MAFDLVKIEERLNAVGLDLMMLSHDNLLEISGFLGRVEAMAETFAPLESEITGLIITALAEGLKDILRGRTTKTDQALAKVGDGLTILSELSHALAANKPFNHDRPAAFQEDLAKLADAQGFWAEVESKAAPPQAMPGTPPPNLADPAPADLSVEGFKTQFTAAVEELQARLVSLEHKNDPQAALGALTRPFRTILGGAALAQFQDAADLAFNATELIEYVLNDHLPYSSGVTDILLATCDYLLRGFRNLEIQPDEDRGWVLRPTPEAYTPQELGTFTEQLWLAKQGVLTVKPTVEQTPAAAAVKPKKIGEMLAGQGLLAQGGLGGLISKQGERKASLGDILVAEKLITQDDLDEALAEQKKEPDRRLEEILVRLGKIEYEQLDGALRRHEERKDVKLGEYLLKSKIGAPEKVARALRAQKQSEGGLLQAAPQVVKVETQKLDGIIDMVGELVIAQSLVNSNPSIGLFKEQKLNKDLAQVTRITSELQRNAMSLRMVTIAATFHKMNRLVRDLAHKFEKDVRLETIGAETEVDRNMVDSIYDPLVHMVRNALDHGIESPAERKAAGKPLQGTVRLRAYHQSGNVVIEMHDDGRGLDTDKVLKKAVEKGLVAPGKVLSDAAIHALVFQPGFSTADRVSEVSGRGVGMDVVQQSIEKLRGKVEFTSAFGRGSTLTLWLPLTLAIIDGMIIQVGGHRYILPTVSIVESFRPLKNDYFTVNNQGEMIKVRDNLVPLLRLSRLVGAEGGVTKPEDGLVVMVENEGETRCLLVDQVLGKQEVVIKSLGETLKGVRTLAGGTILGDGRVGLILDVAGLCGAAAGPAGPDSGETDDWGMGDV
jgi:two-component system chemotaxis sensor kinase CheA